MPESEIPEPLQFNPIKHHLLYIRWFIAEAVAGKISDRDILKALKHTGTSIMDVYTGSLRVDQVANEILEILKLRNVLDHENFSRWTGTEPSEYRLLTLSDGSQWTVKYYNSKSRYVHIFPARTGPHTFRVKANTIKSAILYMVLNGKDYVTAENLNAARSYAGLSPLGEITEADAIAELIEIFRSQ